MWLIQYAFRAVFRYFLEQIFRNPEEINQNVNNTDIYTDGEHKTCLLTAFEPATETEIGVLLKSSPVKSWELDRHIDMAA